MVRKCDFCGQVRNPSSTVSYHRLPNAEPKRQIWISLMGWSSVHPKKTIFICSDHFDPNDIETRAGRRKLKSDANPLPQHTAFENSDIGEMEIPFTSCTCVENEIEQYSMVTQVPSCTAEENEHNYTSREIPIPSYTVDESKPSQYSSETPVSSFTADENEPDQGNSSSTLTASEGENDASRFELDGRTSSNMPTKKRKRRRIGDSSGGYFSTQENRRRCLQNINERQRIEIRYLTSIIRRQNLQIKTLKDLESLLREKYQLSEGSQQMKNVKNMKTKTCLADGAVPTELHGEEDLESLLEQQRMDLIKKYVGREGLIETQAGSLPKDYVKQEIVDPEDPNSCEEANIMTEYLDESKVKREVYIEDLNEISGPQSVQEKSDDTDFFFNTISEIVKKLPEQEQLRVRMQISSLVGDAERRSNSNESETSNQFDTSISIVKHEILDDEG